MTAWQRRWRDLENVVAGRLRHPSAHEIAATEVVPWQPDRLLGSRFCLLITRRRDGSLAPTPMWFAILDGRVVMRSGAEDGKLKRIRRDPSVLIAACDVRGRPRSAPMAGEARILGDDDAERAERALTASLGLERRAYNVVRAPFLGMSYVAVTAPPDDEPSP